MVIPDDGTDVDELLQRADVALYVAKAQHAGVVRYDPGQDHYDAANLGLIAELRRAIDNDELVLHYQPKVTLPHGEVGAVEALVRWQHPTQGLLYPDRFVPLAEQTDLIEKLTQWVLNRALSDMNPRIADFAHIAVAVNVSARNICHAGFAAQVIDALRRSRRRRQPTHASRSPRPPCSPTRPEPPGPWPSWPHSASGSASTTSASDRHRSASCHRCPCTN